MEPAPAARLRPALLQLSLAPAQRRGHRAPSPSCCQRGQEMTQHGKACSGPLGSLREVQVPPGLGGGHGLGTSPHFAFLSPPL